MPDPDYHKNKGKGKARKTRYEQLEAVDSRYLESPEVEHGSQVIEWLNELGMVEQGPNGPRPLSWQEINAWKQATGTQASTEELVMIRRLSSQYVSQYNASDNPQMPSPFRPKKQGADILDDQIDNALDRVTEHLRKPRP